LDEANFLGGNDGIQARQSRSCLKNPEKKWSIEERMFKMKYLEWEDRSEGIVWPVKKKLRYVQSFELPREM